MGDSNFWSTVLIFGLPILAMYFLFIRPQQKRVKLQQQTVNTLQPGARVMTTAGVYGTIVHMGQRQAIIEIAPGVEMTLARQAISKAVSPDEDEFEYDDETPAQTEQGRFDEVVASYDTEAAPDVQATGFERPADDDQRDEPRRDDDSR